MSPWRLDSRIAPALARENSRPYNHYSAVFVPSVVLRPDGQAWEHGQVLATSPLLHVDLPDWMLLHFQADEETGWESPQVLHGALRRRLANPQSRVDLRNVTEPRYECLCDLEKTFPPGKVLGAARTHGAVPDVRDTTLMPAAAPRDSPSAQPPNAPPSQPSPNPGSQSGRSGFRNTFDEQYQRVLQEMNPAAQQKEAPDVAVNNVSRNGAGWLSNDPAEPLRGEEVDVRLSPLMPVWLTPEQTAPRLLWARLVKIGQHEICQGILLDWERLQQVLAQEIADLFPAAHFEPVLLGMSFDPDRTMSTLRVELVPGSGAPPIDPGWTPLRIGLVLAWTAALVALAAVGLGGWSLLDLSERRIRFVSAVTHELRTPLTTLRLYLDMLTGGLVKDETQKAEYLHTLNSESERLNRLVGNVLDFSRLENQRPQLQTSVVTLAALLEGLRETWQGRCHDAGKELIIETSLPAETLLETDVGVAQQVLGNLLDNACKYSKGAEDCRVWVRAKGEGRWLLIDVEDRGPGVPLRERRSIFRPFRRGAGADVTVGGVGLGLALAQRWAELLGGRLTMHVRPEGHGACFRLALPL
jgi:signal transduction histidine kinase